MESRRQPTQTVFTSCARKDFFKHALVLEVAGIRYETHRVGGEFILDVAAADAARATEELEAYAQENPDSPVAAVAIVQRTGGWTGVVVYASVLLLVAILAHQRTFGLDWHTAGKTHAGLIRDGQWWRTVTALTLHADVTHLIGNTVIGGVFGLFAGQLLGNGLAWISILLAGASGNLLNAWIRGPNHTSVGASTAVFAALGIIAAYSWKRRRSSQGSMLARITPLVGAVVLLAYLGTGGARTDVAAHVTGFLSGMMLGILHETLGDRVMFGARVQFFLGVVALAVLALAWALALSQRSA